MFDFTYDNTNFFTAPAQAALERAASDYESRILDNLTAIPAPPSGNSWTASFQNPANGNTENIQNLQLAENEVRVYVGARNLSGSTLGVASSGYGVQYTNASWLSTVIERGQTGDNEHSSWGGSITFDTSPAWHFDASAPTSGTSDLYSVALHELAHLFGISSQSGNTWTSYTRSLSELSTADQALVNNEPGDYFIGPKTVAIYGAPVPAETGHFAHDVAFAGLEASLDPNLTTGTRKPMTPIDWAALDDIGWELSTRFLTGTSFDDSIIEDDSYSDGEGIGGMSVSATNTATNSVYQTTTSANGDYALEVVAGTYTVTFSGGGYPSSVSKQGITVTDNTSLDLNASNESWLSVNAFLDATRFSSNPTLPISSNYVSSLGDDFVSIDPTRSYQFVANAMSGNDDGSQFNAANRQLFGFASFDADFNTITPFHVLKFQNATDTNLAQTLNPGDTQIQLTDATGWNNAGLEYQRTIAWYGYTDSQGTTYDDFTYTRNYLRNAWDIGAISGNTITLSTPWAGPTVAAGTAVRNATSGATYNYLFNNAVPNQQTNISQTVTGTGLTANQFRPGTRFVRPTTLSNFAAATGNTVTWSDISIAYSDQLPFAHDDEIDLVASNYDFNTIISSQWVRTAGPADANIAQSSTAGRATVTTPSLTTESQYTFEFQITTATQNINVPLELNVAAQPGTVNAFLDATRFSSNPTLPISSNYVSSLGDDFVSIDPTRSYQFVANAMSGNDDGSQFNAANRQLFGFASFDADFNTITPFHVLKFQNATDTNLAQTLNPGDTQIQLTDATGWNNAGLEYQRTIAWYGYTDSQGTTYDDFTYTRNYLRNAWDIGAISGNTITLSTPWAGPTVAAGTAVRNATSGATYNYLFNNAVPNQQTNISQTVTGTGLTANQFRPGTRFVRPTTLSNFAAATGNTVTWSDISIAYSDQLPFAHDDEIDLVASNYDFNTIISSQWVRTAGPADANIAQSSTAGRATVTTPSLTTESQYTFEFQITTATQNINVPLELNVAAQPGTVNAFLDATRFSSNPTLPISSNYVSSLGDDFVSIDPTRSYQFVANAMSGNDDGSQFNAANRQLFGFASFDADFNTITPFHVLKFQNATDTNLAQTLNPGDTQIQLTDATGWNNAGLEYQRTIAWYGYTDSQGTTYDDFTYTRNYLRNAWDIGAISGNTITLSTPWAGPTVAAGTAVRNATSGATYNYLFNNAVPNQQTNISQTVTGTGLTANQFRPGTRFVRPTTLSNFAAATGNTVTWSDISIAYSDQLPFAHDDEIDLVASNYDFNTIISSQWVRTAGPADANIAQSSTAGRATVTTPSLTTESQYTFEFQITTATQNINVPLELNVAAQP